MQEWLEIRFAIVFGCSICIFTAFAFGADAFLSKDQIRAQWKQNYCDIEYSKVVTLKTCLDANSTALKNVNWKTGTTMYIERYEHGDHVKCVYADSPENPERVIYFYDNTKTITYRPLAKEALIDLPTTTRRINALRTYVEAEPVYSGNGIDDGPFLATILFAKPTGQVLPKLEVMQIGDAKVSCHVVQNRVTDGTYTWIDTAYMAQDCSMLPIKFERVTVDPNGTVIQKDETVAKKIAQSNGIWYPVLATYYHQNYKESYLDQLQVLQFSPNASLPKDTFAANFVKGTCVADNIKGIGYTIGIDDINQVGSVQKLPKK